MESDSGLILRQALICLSFAVIAVPLFRWLGLGSVLGYLAAGWVIGPWGLSLIPDVEEMLHFSELGVVFLLFIIGLELSPRRLWVMRSSVFVAGSMQVGGSAILIGVLCWAFGLTPVTSFVVGASLALSSTAFALQIMGEKNQIHTAFGRASFGILLFQDLAAIPILAAVPLLLHDKTGSTGGALVRAITVMSVVAAVIFAGRYLLRPLLRIVASSEIREIFTAAALLLVLGIALLMNSVGLSMALGSFLAGVLLADSEHRLELEANIEPFKGLLLGLFFMSIGMSVDYGLALRFPLELIGAVALLLLVKAGVLYGVGRRVGLKPRDARSMALTIPQGGEFAFVILGVAAGGALLSKEVADFLTLVVTLSMAATPFLVMLNLKYFIPQDAKQQAPFDTIQPEENQVIIAGLGRVGQIVSRILRLRKVPFTALDRDQAQVDVLRKFGTKVYYGDATRLELLESAGAKHAKYFVLAIDDMEASLKTAAVVRQHFPHLKVFGRARNRQHAYGLLELGVTIIHRETLGSSLELVGDLLISLGFEADDVANTLRTFREHDEKLLAEQFKVRHDENELIKYSKQYSQQLTDVFEADNKT